MGKRLVFEMIEEKQKNLSPALIRVWDDLVQKVEKDPGIWSKSWFIDPATKKLIRPYNPVTKRNYHGFNLLMLEFSRLSRGYTFNQWLTFNQAKIEGGHINKGEKGTPIIVYNPPKIKTGMDPVTKEETKEIVSGVYFSYAILFNISQTTIEPEKMPEIAKKDYSIPEVENLITKTGAVIHHNYQDRAFYSPANDLISLPLPEQFTNQGDYYETKFHELIHWTGHKNRLNRITGNASFGSDEYSREELIAEIGSVFLKAETGINNGSDNAAAYIKNWWTQIKEDKGSLITAAGKAERALSYILSAGVSS
jgi:antirestriction protein ArdC